MSLCKKCREDSKTAPSKSKDEQEAKNQADLAAKEVAPDPELSRAMVREGADPIPEVTKICVESNVDGYFSPEDKKFYCEKYMNEKKEKRKDVKIKWKVGRLLGMGSFGRVVLGLNKDTGEVMAVKQVLIADVKSQNVLARIRALEMEIEILSQLKHKNIVRYIGSSHDKEFFNIFLEFAGGGSIAELVKKYGYFGESLIRTYAKQILEGLEYLHAHNVIHRDVKGANVLVDTYGICKLADFGGAKKIYNSANTEQFYSLTGTPFWMAPEVIKQTGHGRHADIWSFGCTIIEMATGRPPWADTPNEFAALYYIGKGSGPPKYPAHFSEEGRNFLDLIFQRDPKKRANVRTLLNHPFITMKYDEDAVQKALKKPTIQFQRKPTQPKDHKEALEVLEGEKELPPILLKAINAAEPLKINPDNLDDGNK